MMEAKIHMGFGGVVHGHVALCVILGKGGHGRRMFL